MSRKKREQERVARRNAKHKTAHQLDPNDIAHRILFFYDEAEGLLQINVPMDRATGEFKYEVRTADFVSVSLDTPLALGGNNIRVTFDDGSEKPFVLGAAFEDFRITKSGRMRFCLPTRETLKTVSVMVHDPETFTHLKAGEITKEQAQRLCIIWVGEGRTEIEREGNDYVDGGHRVVCY